MTTPTGPGYGSGGPGGTSGQGGERDGAPEREGVPVSGAPQVGAPGGTPGGAGASPLPPPSATPAMPPATPPATPPTAPRPAAPASPSAAPGGDPRPATPREGFGGNAAAGGAGLGAGATAARPFGGPSGGPSGGPGGPGGGPGGPSGPGTSGGAGGPSGSTTFGTLPGGSTPLRTGKPRRARLVVRRIDPWSVLKFTLLFSLCLLIVFVVAVAALYYALDSMGVFTEVNDFVRELTQASSGGRRTGGVEVPFTATRVIGVAAVIGLINVVLITAISTLGAFLYNLCADIVGGIEITLAERE